MDIKLKATVIVVITLVTSFLPLSCSSSETISDKALNVEIKKQVTIKKQDKEVNLFDHERIPSDIAKAVNNNFSPELDKQILGEYKHLEKSGGRLTQTAHVQRRATIKMVDLSGNKTSEKQNSEDMVVVYRIEGKAVFPVWVVTVLRKEKGIYKEIWTSTPVTWIDAAYFGIQVRNLKDRTEILVSYMAGMRGTGLFIYKWEGNSASLVGNFSGDVLQGGVQVNDNRIIENQYNKINYYSWNGKEYKLYKVEKIEPVR